MQPGQFLVNKNGEKRKIFFANGFIVAFENGQHNLNEELICILTIQQLKFYGWSLLEEPWVPKDGEHYFYLDSCGDERVETWEGGEVDQYRLSVGNCCKSSEDLKKYKQNLIKVMGKKEV